MSSRAEVVRLSPFRADLQRALSRRGKKLLEAADLAEQVAALPPLEAYLIVKELGVADATPILKHCTPEHLRTLVDLDCWRDERPDSVEIDAWLAPFAAEGRPSLAWAFSQLEEEIRVVFLASNLKIYELRNEEPPEAPEGAQQFSTPDGIYVVEATLVPDREINPLFLVDALYLQDMQEAYCILAAAKWELLAPLEEQAFRFREGRLKDLGFPTRDEALHILAAPGAAPVPPLLDRPGDTQPSGGAATLPALYAGCLTKEALFTRAMGRITGTELIDAIERDLVYLVNAAVVAYGESPKDLHHVAEVVSRVRDTLCLGLAKLIGPAAATLEEQELAAAQVLSKWNLTELFRHGHALVHEVAQEARVLVKDPVLAKWLESPPGTVEVRPEEGADRAFVQALCAVPPLWAGYDLMQPQQARAFANLGQVAAARERLIAIGERLL